jgi:two-component system chemotaxis response regulator CheB
VAIRVIIADDSAGVRLAMAAGLRRIPGVEVIATANDGVEVVGKVLALRPDLVTLDLHMPNRDGVSAAAAIHRHCPGTVMALVSGADAATAQAALAFAPHLPLEYIPKPAAGNGFDHWVTEHIGPLIERLVERQAQPRPGPVAPRRPNLPNYAIEAVLIGASTGGPAAVTQVLQDIDPDIGVPVLIVQHMPPVFTEVFSKSLDKATRWTVREAYDRAIVRAGEAWVAQGDKHMKLERVGNMLQLRMDDGPREHGCRPAVDVTFRSAARILGPRCVALVLTGMGRDGSLGGMELHAEGATFVAQDESTSVVWGMPGAVTQAGLPEVVLPLGEIGRWVATRVRTANLAAARATREANS